MVEDSINWNCSGYDDWSDGYIVIRAVYQYYCHPLINLNAHVIYCEYALILFLTRNEDQHEENEVDKDTMLKQDNAIDIETVIQSTNQVSIHRQDTTIADIPFIIPVRLVVFSEPNNDHKSYQHEQKLLQAYEQQYGKI